MSECIDKKYDKMISAFELGLLTDEEYDSFAAHILECEHCFEKVKKFENTAKALRYDSELRQSMIELTDQVLTEEEAKKSKSTERRRFQFPRFIPITAAAAIILIVLLLKPWNININPNLEAIAAENRLAIIDFNNVADPDDSHDIGEIISSLLTADLSESFYMQIVTNQRIDDIIKINKLNEEELSGLEIYSKAAVKAEARWLLIGSVLQIKPHLIMTSQLIELSSGVVLSSGKIEGDEGEDIFSIADRMAVQIKNNLPLPSEARNEKDRRVADVTTHSPEAYRYYLEGIVNYYRLYNNEAIQAFHMALKYDSTFAMVYYYLSLTENSEYIDRAMEHIENASRKDKHIIKSRYAQLAGDYDKAIGELKQLLVYSPDDKEAYYRIGICYVSLLKFDQAIENFEKAIAIDPLYKTVYNHMAYTYDWMFEFDKAIEAINIYISIAPDEANPYDSRGDIYARNYKFEDAIESYKEALKIKPDFWASLYKIGKYNLFLDNYIQADSCFNILSQCPDSIWNMSGTIAKSYITLRRGQFRSALDILNKALERFNMIPESISISHFHYIKSIAYEEMGDLTSAITECKESIRIQDKFNKFSRNYLSDHLIRLLAKAGEMDEAEELVRIFGENLNSRRDSARYSLALGSIEYYRSDYTTAEPYLIKAAEDSIIPYLPAKIMLVQNYYKLEKWQQGLDELARLNKNNADTRLYYGSWQAKIPYYRAIAYENLNQPDWAIESYREFLVLWDEADPNINEIINAKENLNRLTSHL